MSVDEIDAFYGVKYVLLPNGQRVCDVYHGPGQCFSCEGTGRKKLMGLFGPHIGERCSVCNNGTHLGFARK